EAKAGRPASMILKMNSLQDKTMIKKLYDAGRAGVKIDMIIRGICCLLPGVKDVSENITAVSIVDRFLEHARVFVFHHGGKELIYLSSADFMTRNLSFRVETTFPIYDELARERILTILDLQLHDNTKARLLSDQQANRFKRGGSIRRQSQEETYLYLKRQLVKYQEELKEAEEMEEGLNQ
ncbi:MAG: polyphosphate kinase 1, partial [Bacteroidota bacterium]